ncbi:unnamed protein product [Bubo scandiacus]
MRDLTRRRHAPGTATPPGTAPPAEGDGAGRFCQTLSSAGSEGRPVPCALGGPGLTGGLRPCISDDLKIGYYSTDHATQTDIRGIPELKELAIAVQAFIKLLHSLQQDLFIYKSIIQAQYKEKTEEQASNLYKYINDQLTDIEFLHKQVERKIHVHLHVNLYQMPLCDALAVLRANMEKYYNIDGEDTACSARKLLKLSPNKLHEEESIIEDLGRKLQE